VRRDLSPPDTAGHGMPRLRIVSLRAPLR
jgi:hypothetical protein